MSLNQLTLMGKLMTDPEMSYSKNGTAVTKFRMQTENNRSDKPADTHTIITFGKAGGESGLAERCAQFLSKGSTVIVQGKHSEQEFKAQNGKTYLTCQIIAFSVQFMDKKE